MTVPRLVSYCHFAEDKTSPLLLRTGSSVKRTASGMARTKYLLAQLALMGHHNIDVLAFVNSRSRQAAWPRHPGRMWQQEQRGVQQTATIRNRALATVSSRTWYRRKKMTMRRYIVEPKRQNVGQVTPIENPLDDSDEQSCNSRPSKAARV